VGGIGTAAHCRRAVRYIRAAGVGILWACIALLASFALIDLGLSLWAIFLYPTPTVLPIAWRWASGVWGAYAVSFATVGFFFGWVKTLRHGSIEKGDD